MGMKNNRLVSGIAAALLACGLAVTVPAAASAATYSSSCKGSYVTTKYVKNTSGTVLGRVGVYRDGNYMCAVLIKAGPVYGDATWTMLTVRSLPTDDYGYDEGAFRYQTDAIRVYAPTHKIYVNTGMRDPNPAVTNVMGWTVTG